MQRLDSRKGEDQTRVRVRWIEASALQSSKVRKDRAGAEAGRIPKWERSHHESITVHGRHSGCVSRSSALRGVALTYATSDPSTTPIASRIRPPRPRVRSVRSATPWNRVTESARESVSRGSRSPPPHHWRATPRLVDFPAGVRASETGVFGEAARRSHSSRPLREAVPASRSKGLALKRCGRTAAREDRLLDSKSDRSRRQEKCKLAGSDLVS